MEAEIDILNEYAADRVVEKILRRERNKMGNLVEHELVKTVDGRYINVHQGLELTEDEVRQSVEADRKRATDREALLSKSPAAPADAPATNAPQAPENGAAPTQPINNGAVETLAGTPPQLQTPAGQPIAQQAPAPTPPVAPTTDPIQ
jgi:hypothetical protein